MDADAIEQRGGGWPGSFPSRTECAVLPSGRCCRLPPGSEGFRDREGWDYHAAAVQVDRVIEERAVTVGVAFILWRKSENNETWCVLILAIFATFTGSLP
jgi:hypothetical protein